MCEVLQQIGPREDRGGSARRSDDHRGARARKVGEDLIEGVAEVDCGERRLHHDRDVLVHGVRVLEDAVEHPALLERADHVGHRLGRGMADDR